MSRLTPRKLSIAILLPAVMLGTSPADAGKFNRVLDVDAPAPTWSDLRGTDGKLHSLDDYKEHDVVVLFFTDNHCPMSKQYETRLQKFAKAFADKKLAIVAVNVSKGPGETLEKMKRHAKKRKWTFDYLRDPSQKVGRVYGAVRTPQFFVLDGDRKVAYMGSLDENDDPQRAKKHYLHNAVRALLDKKRPSPGETLQRGCKIEYDDKK